jgi:hypothetical protein
MSCLAGLLLLLISLVINYFGSLYANESISNSVTDIILDNIPVINVGMIFVFGPIIFWIVMMFVCLHDPKKIPFTLKSIALFVIIRALFISLTHIGPHPDRAALDIASLNWIYDLIHSNNFFIFSSGGDLFFSGHTGLPYLMALVFWHKPFVRIFCLFSAIFFGIIVLLGHFHYSIDVLSAFFITYSIFHISQKLFKKDWIYGKLQLQN